MSLGTILVSLRLQVFEHKVKKVIAKEDNVLTFYIWERPIAKGFKQHISIYKGGEHLLDKYFSKKVDYQNMIDWIFTNYKNEIKFIERCQTPSFSGGGIYYPEHTSIKYIVHNFSAQAKCVYRKWRKLQTSKKELIKYMGYALDQEPNWDFKTRK